MLKNEIMNLNEYELKELIKKREEELEKSAEETIYLNKIHNGYISKKTKIKVSENSLVNYSLNDIDYYDYISYLKEQNVDINNISSLVSVTGLYVSYFFNYDPYKEYVDKREKYIFQEYKKKGITDILDIFESGYVPSINIFKGTGQGVCLEHSLLMQNLLSFMGMDLTMVIMMGKRDEKLFGHTVNFININTKGKTRHLYYDLVSMEILYDENNQIKTIPTIRIIPNDKYEKFLNEEESIEIARKNVLEENGVMNTTYYVKSLNTIKKLIK